MSSLAEVRESAIDSQEVERAVAHAGAGAIVHFVGRVRDHNDGQPVTLLEYEAYASMATREMRQIVQELEQRFDGTKLAVLHRIGSLRVGDAAVVCAASAPHRTEAFEACRQLIDQIKLRVPIWKREHGPEGPYWVGWQDARCDGRHAGANSLAEGSRHEDADPHAHARHEHADPHAHARHEHADPHDALVRDERHRGAPHLTGWTICCVTVSDTRTAQTDDSGALAERLLSLAGAHVERRLVRDEPTEIQQLVRASAANSIDALLLTGGTGIGPRDVTCETVRPLLTRHIEGFGETFRRLSFDAIGTRAILSRALAGTIGSTLVFVVPGSPGAVQLALESLVIPMLAHARSMIRGAAH